MQAIITKFISPTNHKGSRIKATCERGSFTMAWDDELGIEANHIAARTAMVNSFAREDVVNYGGAEWQSTWLRPMVCGQIPSGEFVHVFVGTFVQA